MFGVSKSQRTLHRSDFHIPPNVGPEDQRLLELFIDVLLEFPELNNGNATPETIAPAFRHMLMERPNEAPVCRMRLEAQWNDDGTTESETSQTLYWVYTLESDPAEDRKRRARRSERGLVKLHYTPAIRNPSTQIRTTTGTLVSRLLRSVEWSENTREKIENASKTLSNAFENENAIKAISDKLGGRWGELYDEVSDTIPGLSVVSRHFEDIVGHVNVVFQQPHHGFGRELAALSEGQQSLFYLALAASVFDLERDIKLGKVEGFGDKGLFIPAHTIFAIEEPENHLSPYYLARIIQQIRSLLESDRAQALITSHSSSVLSRIYPNEVKYCRHDPTTCVSSVMSIEMPAEDQEAAKFVRNAVLSFPELYFARFVLLVEGDSERIVLPRLAEALDLMIDPAFVAIVPLGGRHVNHFWRLLKNLEIPHATLLDLDFGRQGGGFGRVKTVIQQLREFGMDLESLPRLKNGSLLSDCDLAKMHTWNEQVDTEYLIKYVECLREHGVFFSLPLDFDLTMLEVFHNAYEATIPDGGGPKIAKAKAASVILGPGGLKLYEDEFSSSIEHFPAYRYHFLTRSKPATHMAAMAHLEKEEIMENIPETIKTVLEYIAKMITDI